MPFHCSTPIVYYNKNTFKDAGLDPEKPPQTCKELEEAAKKLTMKFSKSLHPIAAVELLAAVQEIAPVPAACLA